MTRLAALACAALVAAASTVVSAQTPAPAPRAAVLDLGDADVRATVEGALRASGLLTLDDGLVDAAARGAEYSGSTNLSLEEARRLARTIGASVLVLGVVSFVERSSDNGSRTGDAFVGLFVVDGVSGRLVLYRACRGDAPDVAGAKARALNEVRRAASAFDRSWRRADASRAEPPWDATALDLRDGGADSSVTPPRFFARPSPKFTDDADRAHAVATVDLVVQFNADGTYGPIEVTRWAGFGLDEAAIEAVRAAKFWPARRGDRTLPARALLRYNFRFRER